MTIDVRMLHPQYADALASIRAARDCFLGERAVKAAAQLYLPKLTGQRAEEYAAYKMRATFYSIVGRTIGALTGLAIQGDIAIKGNQETIRQMKDAPHGMQLLELNVKATSELMLQGRYGVFLDAPEQSRTVGIYGYVSDAIINWDVDGTGAYTMVELQESRVVKDTSNPYKKTRETQYRILSLVNGVYTVQVYDKDSKPIGAEIQPQFGGKTIDYIPFYTATPDGLRAGIDKSPMEDMVSVNLGHYRTSADLENGRHFVGLPTPVVTGTDVAGKLRVGGTQAWVLPDKDADAFYLEFEGQGLQSLENALKEKEAQLASLSSSIISRATRGSESPDAVRMRLSSETASLYTVVKTVEALAQIVYNTKSRLEGNEPDIELSYPTQFVSGHITADEVAKYSKVYIEGGMTVDDYVTILRRGGALSASRTDEQVKSDLKTLAQERADAAIAAKKPNPTTT